MRTARPPDGARPRSPQGEATSVNDVALAATQPSGADWYGPAMAARGDWVEQLTVAQWDELALHIRGAYDAGVPEAELAEALSLAMFPGSVPHFVEAARVWRDLVRAGDVPASETFRRWAAIDQGGFDGTV